MTLTMMCVLWEKDYVGKVSIVHYMSTGQNQNNSLMKYLKIAHSKIFAKALLQFNNILQFNIHHRCHHRIIERIVFSKDG